MNQLLFSTSIVRFLLLVGSFGFEFTSILFAIFYYPSIHIYIYPPCYIYPYLLQLFILTKNCLNPNLKSKKKVPNPLNPLSILFDPLFIHPSYSIHYSSSNVNMKHWLPIKD